MNRFGFVILVCNTLLIGAVATAGSVERLFDSSITFATGSYPEGFYPHASKVADLNGDGRPDAYWGRLSFIRRMDDAGSVNNPQWAHSYSWGPVWYWAVREGQGQIGWPGVPVP